ncbi:GIY-YIG nuclease family protein [Gilvibacter sp.]|uniref:GIY-YIG nuclease family protein n=1 Tax=Gilvibacter sp. TaxID=2729997 RepID=UPI0025BA4C07|nr:GIY-YIG nuclease family protein [Gilvibacter sp.]NQX78775.1 GIY-YIG nuclease family protein [Gilvibacter sp.]
MGFLYILKCSDSSLYVGSTNNINARFIQHQNGIGSAYTRRRRPVKLIFIQQFTSLEEAFWTEKKIKRWSRKKKLALIQSEFNRLVEFSRKTM